MTRLHSDHLQPSGQNLGRQDGGLIPCSRSKHHPHHPALEDCTWCEPIADDMETADTAPPPAMDWSDWTCKACSSLNFGGGSTRCWFCNCPGGTP